MSAERQSTRRVDFALVSRVCALAVFALGTVVLVGWSIRSVPLTSIVSGFPTMNPLTAVCFMASAAVLWLEGPRYQYVSSALALATIIVSSCNLLADFVGFSLRPDQVLFAAEVNAAESPSRMAPSTAVGFIFASISLLLIKSGADEHRGMAQYLAFATGFIALFAAVGYMYGSGTVRVLKPFTLMALHTSLGFLALSIGVLFKNVSTGLMSLVMSPGAGGKMLRLMIPAVIVVPTVLGWISIVGQKQGYFGTPLALTLLASCSMVLLFILTFVTGDMIRRKDQERLRRLQSARASQERLTGILAIAADAIISIDANQRITLFNAWAEKLFGYTEAEVLGRRLEVLLPERFRALHASHVERFSSGPIKARRMGERGEIFARRKDGTTFPAEASISKLKIDGEAIYTVVLRDVTERWQTADALMRAKDDAEAAARSQSEFLANMSHEIRTPLNSISGFTQLLLADSALKGDLRTRVKKIWNSATALTSIVDDILDYSKLEEGMLTLSLASVSPLKLVRNCVAIVASVSEVRQLPIHVVASPSLKNSFYLGDPKRVQQILLNLLSNAVKFTNKGSITVTIAEVDSDPEVAVVRFAVTDTGVGIPADRMDRLFRRFSQVDGSVSRSYGGTGLGLAICKRLVRLMGGEIGVESEVGKGSTFWFQLPMERTVSPAKSTDDRKHKHHQLSSPKRSILLVEDIDLNREIAVAMLEQAGHGVDEACDGAEAVRKVADKRYDLILMDIQMPIMDGITATRKIRAMAGENGSVPIIAMTANVLPEEVEQFREAGMNGHIRKPFDLAELLAQVDRWPNIGNRAVA